MLIIRQILYKNKINNHSLKILIKLILDLEVIFIFNVSTFKYALHQRTYHMQSIQLEVSTDIQTERHISHVQSRTTVRRRSLHVTCNINNSCNYFIISIVMTTEFRIPMQYNNSPHVQSKQ